MFFFVDRLTAPKRPKVERYADVREHSSETRSIPNMYKQVEEANKLPSSAVLHMAVLLQNSPCTESKKRRFRFRHSHQTSCYPPRGRRSCCHPDHRRLLELSIFQTKRTEQIESRTFPCLKGGLDRLQDGPRWLQDGRRRPKRPPTDRGRFCFRCVLCVLFEIC